MLLDNQTTEEESTEQPSAEGTFDFRTSIPSEYAEEACLKDIPDYDTFVKNYVHSQKAIGGMVKLPGEGATPEEIKAFHSKLGVPEDVKEYDKALEGEAWAEGMEPLIESFKEAGLTVNQVKILRQGLGKVTPQSSNPEVNEQEVINSLRSDWGSEFDKNLGIAQETVRAFGGNKLIEALDKSGVGNDPVLIKTFAAIGKALASEGLIDGSNHGAVTKDSALQEAENLMTDKAYLDANDPRHGQVKAEVTRLFQIAYPGSWDN